jgi:hypothetical protein
MRLRSATRRPSVKWTINAVRTAVSVLLIVFLAGCGGMASGTPVPPSSEAEALAHLTQVEGVVRSGDLSHLCDFGSGTCKQILEHSDPAAVPATVPAVIGTRVIPYSDLGGGTSTIGGRVLMLCGRDGLGRRYYSEMLVFFDGGRLVSTGTPYWVGTTIATGSTTEASPAAVPACSTT